MDSFLVTFVDKVVHQLVGSIYVMEFLLQAIDAFQQCCFRVAWNTVGSTS